VTQTVEMHYTLLCPECGLETVDDGNLLACPREHAPALLTSRYASRALVCDKRAEGVYRYQCWLPNARQLENTSRSVAYRSEALCSTLHLPNLWIAFSGYWPERGVSLETATFKDLEVCGVLSRLPRHTNRVLVIASAGNTAAAFARACAVNEIPCLIVVPETGMKKLQFAMRLPPIVKIICLTGNAGYSDAITFADQIAQEDGFVTEGGVKNIGRRDGMGTVMLSAAEAIGCLPDYYFQAIGSGAGAIAAHEAAKRLIRDSRFGSTLPRLMLSQNAPFAPIYDSWKTEKREFAKVDSNQARASIGQRVGNVMSSRR
jgi:cysteate synthase